MSKPDPGMNALGVLALELAGGDAPRNAALTSAQAGELADRVGRDLARLVPGVSGLDFVFAGAHFDPAEVLRPGWPVDRRRRTLLQSSPLACTTRAWRSSCTCCLAVFSCAR